VIGEYTIANRILKNFGPVPPSAENRAMIATELQAPPSPPRPRQMTVLQLIGVARRADIARRRGPTQAS
jgi:hypothetical protein